MGIFLFGRWLHTFLVTVFALAAFDSYGGFAQLEMAVLVALSVLVSPVYFVLLERAIKGFLRLQPKYRSIYDPYFWRHERLWKVPGEGYLHVFDGTRSRTWQAGDLLLVDNVRTAHSREPFAGPREVLVAMTDPVRLADCSPTIEMAAR